MRAFNNKLRKSYIEPGSGAAIPSDSSGALNLKTAVDRFFCTINLLNVLEVTATGTLTFRVKLLRSTVQAPRGAWLRYNSLE